MKEVESKSQVEEVKLSIEDGLTFRTMEAEFYKEQIAQQNAQLALYAAQQKSQVALDALNAFVKTMHEKHGKDQKVSYIDPKTFVFTDRAAPGK